MCVMASYSKINGVYASNNKALLTGILREEWGFDGVVMSDWFGMNSIVPSVEAGLDLEMPGPARKRGKNLVDAVKKGYMKESTLDINVRRILELVIKISLLLLSSLVPLRIDLIGDLPILTKLKSIQIYKTGKYKNPDWVEEQEEAINRPEHQKFLRRAASEGIVLLKNEKKLLPLSLGTTKQIAFIGPNAKESVAAGGG